MLSRVIPLEYLKERDVMFWLPPGGQDNDVWADTWVIIAELESADAEPALELLRDNDIGAYVASPSGRKGAPGAGKRLYVDREQHTKAADVLMVFLRKKGQPVVPVRTTRKPGPAAKVKPRAVRILVTVLKICAAAAFIALFLVVIYREGPRLFPTVHHAQHPTPTSDGPLRQRP